MTRSLEIGFRLDRLRRARGGELLDLVDATKLVEERPELAASLTSIEREALDRLPS